jgi:MerR family transcriptional regulator, thiopeptide resistance regulator
MKSSKGYTVKDVAQLAGVSVRTLHYYDSIGLLIPSDRTAAGYRLYSASDLLRLQQIMLSRKLGLSLKAIRRSLDDPAFDLSASLRRQRALLTERLDETGRIIASIDAALERLHGRTGEKSMTMNSVFDGFDPSEFTAEAEARWGNTSAYQESTRRAQSYNETQRGAIKGEQDMIWAAAAAAMHAGEKPDSEAAIGIAIEHRRHIDRWFYPLTPKMHVRLAQMWESDARFEASIDRCAKGLTHWMARAVEAAASG